MLEIRHLGLDGVIEILPQKIGDERGFFSETYNQQKLAKQGIDLRFVQDNHSFSKQKGVLRGLHYQLPPMAQHKLVRVVRGRIFDVAVDIRRGSPTFGKWVGLEVSAEKWNQILIPTGFAHGFLTLEENTEVVYKVSSIYSYSEERTIRFNDPEIDIEWPGDRSRVILSAKDSAAPFLAEAEVFNHH